MSHKVIEFQFSFIRKLALANSNVYEKNFIRQTNVLQRLIFCSRIKVSKKVAKNGQIGALTRHIGYYMIRMQTVRPAVCKTNERIAKNRRRSYTGPNEKNKNCVNEPEKETHPRTTIRTYLPSLSDEEVKAIELFHDLLDQELLDRKREGNFSAWDMCDLLSPYLKNPLLLSRLHPDGNAYYADSRHIDMDVMVAMRRVFNVDINGLIDSAFEYLPPREPPRKPPRK